MKKSFLPWCIGLGVLSAWAQADGPMAVEASAPSLQATVSATTQAATSRPVDVSLQPTQVQPVATPVAVSTVADETPVEPVAIEITPGPLDDSPVRVVWRGTPIPLTLPLGKERQVRFPGPVRVGIPVELNTGPLRTQSLSGTVYWTASAPFTARVQVLEEQSGRLYLIDLTTSEEANASVRPIQIVWGANDGQAGGKPLASGVAGAPLASSPTAPDAAPAPSAPASSAKDGKPAVKPPGYVELTRFMAQHVYAPERLRKAPVGVQRLSIKSEPTQALLRGGQVQATPLAAWQAGRSVYLTLVALENTGADDLILDPRDLRGAWLTATFQHARLFPAGHSAARTSAYLISSRPFAEAIKGREHHGL